MSSFEKKMIVGPVQLGYLLIAYLAVDPLYDALTVAPYNLNVGGLRVSDWISLFFLGSFSYFISKDRFRLFRLDGYSLSLVAITIYRLFLDSFYPDTNVGEDIPRMFLNLILYASASVAVVRRKHLLYVCHWVVLILGVSAFLQVAAEGISVRASSIYLIPNFLAFNSLNIFVLYRLAGADGFGGVIGQLASLGLIALSKTRTVIISLVFFFSSIRSPIAKYGVVLVFLVFYLLGAGESVRIAGHVDDFWNFDGRVPIWVAIYDRIDDFNLFFGSGSDALRRLEVFVMYDDAGDQLGFLKAQNHYIQTLVELGFVGLVIWTAGILSYVRLLLASRRWNAHYQTGLAFVSSLLMVQLFENDLFVNPTVSIVLGMLVSKRFVLRS